eukprot:NODE_340_length_10646_cov_0.202522.p1 type:complete len:673 gc:universal NODE_340_length_10646_cov_0.202522:1040-3058(+)
MDQIIVNKLHVPLIVGVDFWERKKPQNVLITIKLGHDFEKVAITDDIQDTLDYTKLQKQLSNTGNFEDLESLVNHLSSYNGQVLVELPRGALFSSCIKLQKIENYFTYFIQDLQVETIIGVNPHERISLQPILIHLEMKCSSSSRVNYRLICKEIRCRAKLASFKTIEALNIHLLKAVFDCHLFDSVSITIDKTSALSYASSSRVVSFRNLEWYKQIKPRVNKSNIFFLSIGSNVDPITNIHNALDKIELYCNILDTSFLYESLPMYIKDQPKFLNCVVKASTNLEPIVLLKYLKQTEMDLKRFDNYVKNGPRPIDLDILYYESLIVQIDSLSIPHPSIQEREFVLQPMCDIAPHFVHPTLSRNQQKLLDILLQTKPSELRRVIPINGELWDFKSTKIMGILNVTPDSFSDGNSYNTVDLAVERINEMVSEGADIIDIGGQSTRPNAQDVGVEEELKRVLPVLKLLNTSVPISVDTYRSVVANEVILNGASIINDVSSCQDPQMLQVVKKHKVPIVMMHMRGNSSTMSSLTNYKNDTVNVVQKELTNKVRTALSSGIPRWLIIVDPGLGFAKTVDQNIELIKLKSTFNEVADFSHSEASYCVNLFKTFPVLMGPSRKAFIGAMTDKEIAKDRVMGTAAVVTVCIENGCNFVRVHDVKEMKEVIKAADYIYNK